MNTREKAFQEEMVALLHKYDVTVSANWDFAITYFSPAEYDSDNKMVREPILIEVEN